VIYNTSYRPLAEVRPGNGLVGDVHEFLITKNNTALFTVYHRLPVDLSSVGGPKEGKIWDGIVQEVDIRTGKVVFEWHSYPQVGIKESYAPPPKAKDGAKAPPYDYFHVNSIAAEPNGNFLISARNTHTIYEVDRKTKKVLWRLGGKKSDFKQGAGVHFAWQHDARRQAERRLVQHEERRTGHQRPCNTVHLLFATTQGACYLSLTLVEARESGEHALERRTKVGLG